MLRRFREAEAGEDAGGAGRRRVGFDRVQGVVDFANAIGIVDMLGFLEQRRARSPPPAPFRTALRGRPAFPGRHTDTRAEQELNASPSSASRTPAMTLSRVDFPAPLRPTRPTRALRRQRRRGVVEENQMSAQAEGDAVEA